MAQHFCYSPSRRKDDTCHFWSYATSLRNQRTEGSGNVSWLISPLRLLLIRFRRNVVELSQIAPSTALFYSFHTPTIKPIEGSQLSNAKPLGPAAALEELHTRGCSLATEEWVTNHWQLVLWKLAGMVALEPEAESNPNRKRWCWPEVIRQLLYRLYHPSIPFFRD